MSAVPTKKAVAKGEPETVATFAEIKVELIAVQVPYVLESKSVAYPDLGQSNRCDLGLLTKEQARKLRAIRRGYDYSQKRLANGGEVKSLADAVRAWLDSVEI
jgi:hypothetical protein